MRVVNQIIAVASTLIMLSSCENKVTIETTVNEDGSVDKSFTIPKGDTAKGDYAIKTFGVLVKDGWTKTSSITRPASVDKDGAIHSAEFKINYTKAFPSVKEMNEALGYYSDTTLQTTAIFEKRFRWFYTYIFYSETYHPINKLSLPIDDYITREDSAFIDRLPAEGKKISKADSVYLASLNDKIFEKYGLDAVKEEYFQIMLTLIRSQKIEKRWEDTLRVHTVSLFKQLTEDKNIEADYLPKQMEAIGIPLDYIVAQKEFDALSKRLELKLAFITWTVDGKYNNIINMPGEVVNTNADSISGNRLFFNPPAVKFIFKTHTLYAESRKMNYWAVIVSVLIIGFTIFLFVRKK
ncbi:hypothetical protein [Pseudochryseolinea flava]|uniref:Transmembrane protein n=1 Tax=Pseudochryseolinea flava TaxID=2059302 RepID=A0A364Y234_9BACT|nr:hypothetical protein [Pseudochryseolinea flava]RAW00830.1 hypothetical protein DQQ10_11320 [Pseudochryseolinea flava]